MDKDLSNKFLFTSEQVSGGHPDKMCDYISDSILDEFLKTDPNAKVACETLMKNNHVVVAGEISSFTTIDYENVIRKALRELGYCKEAGLDPDSVDIRILIEKQSQEIAESVHL